MNYYTELKNDLSSKNFPYKEIKDGIIEIYQQGKNIPAIRLIIGFDDVNKHTVWIKCYSLGHFDDNSYANGLIACNNANKTYRWVKFCIDRDNDVEVGADAIVSEGNVFNEIIELIARMLNIVDEIYPSFMKARWA